MKNTYSRLEIALSVTLGLFLLFLAVRGFWVPDQAATGFGISIENPSDLFYLRVKADRDLSSGLAVFALLGLKQRRALGVFTLVAMVQPVFDLLLSVSDPRGHALYALMVHGSAVVYGIVLGSLLLRRRGTAPAT